MKKALSSLLNQIDLIANEYDEVSDTYVLDQMRGFYYESFVET